MRARGTRETKGERESLREGGERERKGGESGRRNNAFPDRKDYVLPTPMPRNKHPTNSDGRFLNNDLGRQQAPRSIVVLPHLHALEERPHPPLPSPNPTSVFPFFVLIYSARRVRHSRTADPSIQCSLLLSSAVSSVSDSCAELTLPSSLAVSSSRIRSSGSTRRPAAR